MRELVCQTVQKRRLNPFFLQNQFDSNWFCEPVCKSRPVRASNWFCFFEQNQFEFAKPFRVQTGFAKKISTIFGFARFGKPVCASNW